MGNTQVCKSRKQKPKIQVSPELIEFLKENGKKGDSYEEIIWRMLGKKEVTKETKKAMQPKNG